MRIWKQALVSLAVVAAAGVRLGPLLPGGRGGARARRHRHGIGRARRRRRSRRRAPARGAAPVVLGAPVVEARINDFVSAIGDGRAARSVTITPYVAGRVAAIDVASGDFVAAGDDPRPPRLRDRGDRPRPRPPRRRGRRDRARAQPRAARDRRDQRGDAPRERARRRAGRRSPSATPSSRSSTGRSAAPFDGWVGIIGVDVGDQVSTETEVATLDDRSRILVDFRIPERFVGQVKVGAPVTARPLALAGGHADRRGRHPRQPRQPRHPDAAGAGELRQRRRHAPRRHVLLDHHALPRRHPRRRRSAGGAVERRRRLRLGVGRRPGEAGAGAASSSATTTPCSSTPPSRRGRWW